MPVSKGELRYALEQAVRLAYAAFEGYPKPRDMEMSPARERHTIMRAVNDGSLRTLGVDSLGPFATSALWTVGGLDDYRHFLPRILELAVFGGPWSGLKPETIAAKLKYATWLTWPEQEQSAVRNVFAAGWPFLLTQHPDEVEADRWLEGMAELGMDTSEALAIWQDSLEFGRTS